MLRSADPYEKKIALMSHAGIAENLVVRSNSWQFRPSHCPAPSACCSRACDAKTAAREPAMTAALELEMLPDQMLYKVGCPAALAKAAQTTVAAVALARAVVQNA